MSRALEFARWPALLLYAAVGLLYAFSGLLAPWWGVAVLWAVFAGLTLLLVSSWRRGRHWLVVLSPVIAYGSWAVVVLMGEWLFGWTA